MERRERMKSSIYFFLLLDCQLTETARHTVGAPFTQKIAIGRFLEC